MVAYLFISTVRINLQSITNIGFVKVFFTALINPTYNAVLSLSFRNRQKWTITLVNLLSSKRNPLLANLLS